MHKIVHSCKLQCNYGLAIKIKYEYDSSKTSPFVLLVMQEETISTSHSILGNFLGFAAPSFLVYHQINKFNIYLNFLFYCIYKEDPQKEKKKKKSKLGADLFPFLG